MKVLIIGSRGIPNRYGGFEELAERLGSFLATKKHEVVVYNPHHHSYRHASFEGVRIAKAYDPHFLGAFGQFIYDLHCIWKSRFEKPDLILQLGYTSSAVWFWLLPRKARIITNMDGLEWQRSKYNAVTKIFLRLSEKIAATQSHLLIADHKKIEAYLQNKYTNQTVYIPYGADIPLAFETTVFEKYPVKPEQFYLVIARMEPENHVEEIIKGVIAAKGDTPILVIGNLETKHGKQLQAQYNTHSEVVFAKANYNKSELNALRHYAKLYFHGHSVGGTNPSLLEAMACSATIAAHNNPFNKGVLGKQAHYFSTAEAVAELCLTERDLATEKKWQRQNLSKIRTRYNWRTVADQYEISMKQLILR